MNDEIVIRATSVGDIDPLALVAEATGLFPADLLPEMIAGYLEGRKADIWLTAEAVNGPVAFAFCEPERMTNGTWNLLAIGVTPNLQSRGIGAKLVAHLEKLLRDAGHRILLVETIGTPGFARTRSFYLSYGFTQEAVIRDFYDVGDDKVVFWKRVQP